MNKISKNEASKIIAGLGGSIFGVRFVKKDGSVRDMQCRRQVKKGVTGKGMAYNPQERGLMPVYDMANGGFRMINLDTLQILRAGGKEYEVA